MSPSVPHVASVLFLACFFLALANPDNPTFLSPAAFPSSLLFWSPTTITLVRASVRAGERTGGRAGRQAEETLYSSPVHFGALLQTVISQIVVIFAVSFRYGKVDERERERCEDM